MTPQQIEAMKLALEALKLLTGAWQTFGALDYGDNAITAIEEVLAEHAMREVQRLGQEIEQKIGCVNHDCDQCKAQPEQEPVACKTLCELCVKRGYTFCANAVKTTHIYTSPPQRTEQEPVAWHTNSPSDPEICNEQSAQACGPVYCGDSGGYCNKCPKQKIIQAVKPCKGMNCGCTDGRSHSLECLAELAAALGIKENT